MVDDDFSDLIGMTLTEATASADERGVDLRVMMEDGEGLFGTCDYRLNRLNIATEDGIVVSIDGFG